MASLVSELLQPQVILRVISRIDAGKGPLGRWLGFQNTDFDDEAMRPTGPNQTTNSLSGDVRIASWRIFDHSRVIAKARAPGTGPATVAPNPIGQQQISCARFHQKISLLYEFLGNLSAIVGPNSQVDPGGQDYITRQETFLAHQFNCAIEALAAGMMRNSLYFIYVGDDWLVSFTPPTGTQVGFQVNFLIPAGNTGQLNMLGTGNIMDVSWNNNGAGILGHIMQIKAASAQLTGKPMTNIWINSTMWPNIIQNTQVRNAAGIATQPFAEYDQVPEGGMAKGDSNQYAMVLRGDPTVTWHITDDVLVQGNTDIDPVYSTAPAAASLSKLIPDNLAIFGPPDNMIQQVCQLYLGGEYVVENPGMPGVLRRGMYFWKEYTTQPSGIDLIGVLNATPMLFIPKAIAPATVIFP